MRPRFFISMAAIVLLFAPLAIRGFSDVPLFPGTAAYELLVTFAGFGLPQPIATSLIVLGCGALVLIGLLFWLGALRRLGASRPLLTLIGVLAVTSPVFLGLVVFRQLWTAAFLLFSASVWALARRQTILAVMLGVIGFMVTFVSSGLQPPLIVDFGGAEGHGLFLLIAAMFGVKSLWRTGKPACIALVAGILVSLAYNAFLIPGMLAAAYLGGIGLFQLWRARWVYPLVKTLCLVLLACGILFSAAAFIVNATRASPGATLAADFAELRYMLPEGGVLTHPANAAWLDHWAGRAPAALTAAEFDSVWYSRNLEQTAAVLERHGIRSIVLTRAMLQGQVWSEPDEGLLFLLHNSKAFGQSHEGADVQVWMFDPAAT